ncbi:MAG: S-layer homology domain-containing protein [Thermoanaerobacterales bacterium]|nr:S-layer homology domain-containing protein [Thermoanaerobacterales bacterium]
MRRLSIILAAVVMGLLAGAGLAWGAEEPAVVSQGAVVAAGEAGKAPGATLTEAEAMALAKKVFPQLEGLELRAEFEENAYEARRVWNIRTEPEHFRPGPWAERVWIAIDADTGTILHSDIIIPPGEPVPGRVLTREEARAAAEAFIAKMVPAEARAHLRWDDGYTGYQPKGTLSLVYSFHWNRMANGIPVSGDGVTAQVDAVTGEVVGYNLSWHPEIGLPDPNGVMPPAEITQRVLDELGLVPQYVIGEPSATALPEVRLVYQLNSLLPFFDARTGQALGYEGQAVPLENARLFDRAFSPAQEAPGAAPPAGRITPEEGLAAATAFFRALGYEGRVERSGGGSSGGPGYRIETWGYAVVPEGQDRRGMEPTVQLDTRNGGIVSFFSEERGVSAVPGKVNLTYRQAYDRALAFLRQVEPDLADSLVRQQNSRQEPEGDRYAFRFSRLVNGIPFPYRGIMVTISAADGRVLDYHNNLYPHLPVPPVTGMIDPARATEIFKARVAPQLIYYFTRERDGRPTGKAALVYHFPDLGRGIDAHTGAIVAERQGPNGRLAAYAARIGNHWARAPLLLLAENGFLPDPEKFDPNRTISRREGVRLLAAAATRYWDYPEGPVKPPFTDLKAGDPDLVYFDRAVQMGLFAGGGAFNPQGTLTREQFAAWLVNALGCKEVARIRGRIESPFKDAKSVTPGLANYVALAGQLGLMGGDAGGNFRPQAGLTWGEAAAVVTKAVPRLQNNPLLYRW